MPATINLYRYLAEEWALKSLRERRLRASRVMELNDPFEWRIGTVAETPELAKAGREAFDKYVKRINDTFGIISLSAELSDPVIWSHYADSHRGIALEFDHVHDESLDSVVYSHSLPIIDVSKLIRVGLDSGYTLSILRMALARKSLSWGYEREYRVHLDIQGKCEKDGENYFTEIPDDFLTRVILGIRCEATVAQVEAALAEGGFEDVEVVRARMSETTYEILCD